MYRIYDDQYGMGNRKSFTGFKAYPFAIVAINILIAVASDFESAINGWYSWWLSSEDVWLYGGWHNVFNGIAGIINILCMTGWWAVYTSKRQKRHDLAGYDLGLHPGL